MDSLGSVTLVKDINPGTGSSDPANLFAWNSKLLFVADDIIHGAELWISDGTEAGTQLVKDIRNGFSHSNPQGFTEFNNEIFFIATGDSGRSIWKTDGTGVGTVEVIPANHVQPYSSYFSNATASYLNVVGNYFYFGGTDQGSVVKLWRTDGTDAGTEMVADICPGCTNNPNVQGYFAEFFFDGTLIYFCGNDNVHGYEPWILDLNTIGIHKPIKGIPELSIYPNPANDFFQVQLSYVAGIGNYNVGLFDLFGRRIKSIDAFSQMELRINCEDLFLGIYHLVLTNNAHEIVVASKVIIQ